MSRKATLIKIVLPLVVVLAGLAGMRMMIASRPEPRKVPRENPGALVETLTVTRGDRQIRVYGTGTVQARQQIEITPQVGGRVVETSPSLVAGGYFRAGDLLFRIEETDYRLAVNRAQAALAKAEYELATVEGLARVARQEWERLQLDGGEGQPNPLVLYEPQLKNAQAGLQSARAALEQAELDLQRTAVHAPFAGIIRSESVDLGQVVRAGSPVAVLAGTDQGEIVVPLPLAELGWLQIPRPGASGEGSAATVQLTTAQTTHEWSGRILRSLGEVDPQGRMARVVVAIDDPYGLQSRDAGGQQLAFGTFVQVILHGETLRDVAALPAAALRDGDRVWIMNESHLLIRPVEVIRRAREEIVVGQGLAEGEQVVLTNVAGAAEGMKLRPIGAEAQNGAATER